MGDVKEREGPAMGAPRGNDQAEGNKQMRQPGSSGKPGGGSKSPRPRVRLEGGVVGWAGPGPVHGAW